MARYLILGLLLLCPSFVSAQTIRMVDDDGQAGGSSCDGATPAHLSPRDAIAAAASGDTVLVCPGTYVNPPSTSLTFAGKNLSLRSTHGSSVTILDGNLSAPVVRFSQGEGRDALLEGFTIQNGRRNPADVDRGGGGIHIIGSSPTIRGNVITSNWNCPGGGIHISSASPLVEDNTISNNYGGMGCLSGVGGGISISNTSAAVIRRNTITSNEAPYGGGVSISATGPIRLEGNVISGNVAGIPDGAYSPYASGAIYVASADGLEVAGNLVVSNQSSAVAIAWRSSGGTNVVVNNTIANNQSADAYAVFFVHATSTWVNNVVVAAAGEKAITCATGLPPFRFNNVYSNTGSPYGPGCVDPTGTTGNISADPRFVDAAGGNYRVQPDSPNIEAGENDTAGQPSTDLDRRARVLDGNADGIPRIDVGAYEVGTHPRDLNGDGRMDLVFQHEIEGDLTVWAMEGATRTANLSPDPASGNELAARGIRRLRR